MVKNVDYQSRRKAVLAKTIDRYIKGAQAVASEELAREFDLSSATIRNIFSELEEDGYLTHPYTSGGRIPTAKGYRYYVDFLISQMQLLDEEKRRIAQEYKKGIGKMEEVLEATSELISAVTRYTGIVSFLDWQDRMFYRGIGMILEQPEFQDATMIKFLIRMLEDKRRLLDIINRDFNDKVKIYIGQELECPEMKNCALVVSNYKLKKRSVGRLAVLGPMRMEYNHIIPALEYVSDVLSSALDEI